MKTKYLFYSLALAGMFAACSQEELVDAPIVKDNITNRPVAGVVEFSTEGVESRFNYEKQNGFEKGDVLGLYLMDEFDDSYPCAALDSYEHGDANTTLWKWQDHWFGMYSFVNYIQSNYPFRYISETGKWKNDAKLVEGNYFAMFPQNEKALNRRDLWRVIDPAVELKKHSTKEAVYQNVENQFWLDYKQIYRDETASAEGVMTMSLAMKNVLVPLRISLLGWQGNDVKLDKISFKDKYGKPLPTIAYVEPASYQRGTWVKATNDKAEWINCGKEAHGIGLYDKAKTWTKRTVQSLVRWAIPGENGEYPYGLEDADRTTAYEYSFEFPTNTILKGDVNNGDLVTAYVVVPALNDEDMWNSLQVTIYGWRYIKKSTGNYWEYGLLTSNSNKNEAEDENQANYTFLLSEQVNAWLDQSEGTNYYRDVEVRFDNLAWTAASESVSVASTEDMEKMVFAHLQEVKNKDVELTIRPDAAGIEIHKSFIDALDKISTEEGRSIELNFLGGRRGKVFFNEDNTMAISTWTASETSKKLTFNYGDGIELINNATQKVHSGFSIENATVENNGTMTVEGYVEYIENNATLTIASNDGSHGNDNVGTIDNGGLVTLKCHATVGTLNNQSAGKTIVDAFVRDNHLNAVTVGSFNNEYEHECRSCVPAELVVKTGTLNVTTLINDGKLTNDSKIVAGRLINRTHVHDDQNDPTWTELYAMVNNGTIKGTKVENEGIIKNYGKIESTVANNNTIILGDEARSASIEGDVENEGTIEAYNGKIKTLKNALNTGYLYVYSELVEVETSVESVGNIVFVGVAPQHVGTQGKDNRIFQTVKDIRISELEKIVTATAVKRLYVSDDIIVDAEEDEETGKMNILMSYENRKNIDAVVVMARTGEDSRINIKGETQKLTFNLPNAQLIVNPGSELHIENALKFAVKNYRGSIHVGTNSQILGTDLNSSVDHNDFIIVNTYEEYEDAVNAVNVGGVVRMNDDLVVDYWNDLNPDGKDFILDLNAKTLTVNNYTTAVTEKLHIKNGTILSQMIVWSDGEVFGENLIFAVQEHSGSEMGTVYMKEGAVVNLKNCTFNSNNLLVGGVANDQVRPVLTQGGLTGELVLNGCLFLNSSQNNPYINPVGDDASVAIYNCQFKKALSVEFYGREKQFTIESNTFEKGFGFATPLALAIEEVKDLSNDCKFFVNELLKNNSFKSNPKISCWISYIGEEKYINSQLSISVLH